jgi:hypothetical protein
MIANLLQRVCFTLTPRTLTRQTSNLCVEPRNNQKDLNTVQAKKSESPETEHDKKEEDSGIADSAYDSTEVVDTDDIEMSEKMHRELK